MRFFTFSGFSGGGDSSIFNLVASAVSAGSTWTFAKLRVGGAGALRFLRLAMLERIVPLGSFRLSVIETLSSISSSSNGFELLRLDWETPAVIPRPVVSALYRDRGVEVTILLPL